MEKNENGLIWPLVRRGESPLYCHQMGKAVRRAMLAGGKDADDGRPAPNKRPSASIIWSAILALEAA